MQGLKIRCSEGRVSDWSQLDFEDNDSQLANQLQSKSSGENETYLQWPQL